MALVLLVDLLAIPLAAGPAGAQDARIVNLAPNRGTVEGGTVVSIGGRSLATAVGVRFGDLDAVSFVVIDDRQVIAEAPPQLPAAGGVPVTVELADGTVVTGPWFNYVVPLITGLGVRHAVVGGDAPSVSVRGQGFTGVTAEDVMFAGVPAVSAHVFSDTVMYVVPDVDPATATPGAGDVTVRATYGPDQHVWSDTATDRDDWYYLGGEPTVTAIRNAAGDEVDDDADALAGVGETLTLEGTDLYDVRIVSFGPYRVAVVGGSVAPDGTSVRVTVPSVPVGPMTVVVETPFGASSRVSGPRFGFLPDAEPSVRAVVPGVLDVDTGGLLLVEGRGFTGATATDVLVAGVAAERVTVVSDHRMIVQAGAGVAGPATLEVANARAGFAAPVRWSGLLRYE